MPINPMLAKLSPPKNCYFVSTLPNGVSMFRWKQPAEKYDGEKLRQLRAERGVGSVRKIIKAT